MRDILDSDHICDLESSHLDILFDVMIWVAYQPDWMKFRVVVMLLILVGPKLPKSFLALFVSNVWRGAAPKPYFYHSLS